MFFVDFPLSFSIKLPKKNPPPSIRMSRENRAKDINVMLEETISVWISPQEAKPKNKMTLFRLEREAAGKQKAAKIFDDNFSHVRFFR